MGAALGIRRRAARGGLAGAVGQETVGTVGLPPASRGGKSLVRSTLRSDAGPVQLKAAHNSDAGIGRFLEPLTAVCRVCLRTGFFAPAMWCAERTLLALRGAEERRVRGRVLRGLHPRLISTAPSGQ